MRTKFLQLVLAALAMGVVAMPAPAWMLYGVQLDNPDLVRVDSLTGFIVPVGPLPVGAAFFDPVQGLTGTADGTLLYTDGNALPGVQVLDPSSGALITTHALPGVFFRGGLSFDSDADRLYTVNGPGPVASQLGLGHPVVLDFVPTVLPAPPGAIGGDDNGRHFVHGFIDGAGGPAIHEFDPLTGLILNSLPSPSFDVSGLAYDGESLFLSDSSSNWLFTLNPNTGDILHQVVYEGAPLTALAYLPAIPIPAALPLFLSAVAGLGFVGRRRKV